MVKNTVTNTATGTTLEEYYLSGQLATVTHRNHGGLTHNENGPAYILYSERGNLVMECYYINDLRSRNGDLPAEIIYYENGNIRKVEYYKNNFLHRDGDLPANLGYDENGICLWQEFYSNGKVHRETGPACIEFDENGNISDVEYYINGKKKNKRAYLKKYLPHAYAALIQGKKQYIIEGERYTILSHTKNRLILEPVD